MVFTDLRTSTDCGPRSTKSPKNRKSDSGGRPAASNSRSRSLNWPCKSPTTLMGARSRNNIGCRRNARRASAHRARMRRPSQSPAVPNSPSTMSSSVQLYCRRDITVQRYNNGIIAVCPVYVCRNNLFVIIKQCSRVTRPTG